MIYLRRFAYHARRRIRRLMFGTCGYVSGGMLCSGWAVHPGPHTFTYREWRRTSPHRNPSGSGSE